MPILVIILNAGVWGVGFGCTCRSLVHVSQYLGTRIGQIFKTKDNIFVTCSVLLVFSSSHVGFRSRASKIFCPPLFVYLNRLLEDLPVHKRNIDMPDFWHARTMFRQ